MSKPVVDETCKTNKKRDQIENLPWNDKKFEVDSSECTNININTIMYILSVNIK